MLRERSVCALTAGAAILTALLGGVGCGGMSAGDYVTYRVASEATKLDPSCYPNGEIPTNIKDDKTTFRSGATFMIYVAAEDDALLDTGDSVMTGSVDGDSYSFKGSITDVEYLAGSVIFDSDHDGIEDNMDPMVDADMDGQDDNGVDSSVDVDNDGLDDRFQDGLVDANNDGEDDRYVEQPSDTRFIDTDTVTVSMTAEGDTISGTSKTKVAISCEGSQCPANYNTSCTQTSKFKGVQIEETDAAFGGGQGPGNP